MEGSYNNQGKLPGCCLLKSFDIKRFTRVAVGDLSESPD